MKFYCGISIIFLLFYSCSKDSTLLENKLDGNLTIKINLSTKNADLQANIGNVENDNKEIIEEQVFEDFNADVSYLRSGSLSKKKLSTITTDFVSLANDVKCRIKIREKNTSTFLIDQVITNNVASNLKLDGGKVYEYFAYTTNDNIAPPDINASGTISKDLLSKKDFLFDKGEFTSFTGNNLLNIVLKRKVSKISIEVDVQGQFGTIQDNSKIRIGYLTNIIDTNTYTNFLRIADFNIYSDSFVEETETTVSNEVLGLNMIQKNSNTKNAVKIANFYTINDGISFASNSIYVRFDKMNIKVGGENHRTRVFPRASGYFQYNNLGVRQYDYAPMIRLNNTSLTIQDGVVYQAKVATIEKGLVIANKEWARTDLYYIVDEFLPNPYRFLIRFNNDYSSSNTISINNVNTRDKYYWKYLSLTPTGSKSTNINNDPCRKVLPEGKWRMPTITEFNNLRNYILEGSNILNNGKVEIANILFKNDLNNTWYKPKYSEGVSGVNYYQVYPNNFWTYTSDYNNQSLIFALVGYLDNSNVLNSNSSESQFWLYNPIDLSTQYYARKSNHTIKVEDKQSESNRDQINDVNIPYLQGNLSTVTESDYRRTIRCVRNN